MYRIGLFEILIGKDFFSPFVGFILASFGLYQVISSFQLLLLNSFAIAKLASRHYKYNHLQVLLYRVMLYRYFCFYCIIETNSENPLLAFYNQQSSIFHCHLMIPHMLSNHNLSLNILPPLFSVSKLPLTGMICTLSC